MEMKGYYLIIFPCCCKNNFQEGKNYAQASKNRFYKIHKNSKIVFIIKQNIFSPNFGGQPVPYLPWPFKRTHLRDHLQSGRISGHLYSAQSEFWLTLNMLIF